MCNMFTWSCYVDIEWIYTWNKCLNNTANVDDMPGLRQVWASPKHSDTSLHWSRHHRYSQGQPHHQHYYSFYITINIVISSSFLSPPWIENERFPTRTLRSPCTPTLWSSGRMQGWSLRKKGDDESDLYFVGVTIDNSAQISQSTRKQKSALAFRRRTISHIDWQADEDFVDHDLCGKNWK